MGSYLNYTLPLILGENVSGIIEEVGTGVTDFSPGDSVYTRAGVYRDGANAEYVWPLPLMSLSNLTPLTISMPLQSLMWRSLHGRHLLSSLILPKDKPFSFTQRLEELAIWQCS